MPLQPVIDGDLLPDRIVECWKKGSARDLGGWVGTLVGVGVGVGGRMNECHFLFIIIFFCLIEFMKIYNENPFIHPPTHRLAVMYQRTTHPPTHPPTRRDVRVLQGGGALLPQALQGQLHLRRREGPARQGD